MNDMRELVRAASMRKRIGRAIRGKLARAIRGGRPVALEAVTRWTLARYPDDLDEAYTRRLVREIATDWARRSRLK